MRKFIIVLLATISLAGVAQDAKQFGIQFKGFVKNDVFFDSRQTADAREGHFLLYPQNEFADINGDDINAKSKFNILSIQTRLKGIISGPDAFGAKTSGAIEGAFFGNIGTDINGFRLRHAFVKLTWPTTELLVGQYWHPMFVTGCFPGTVSFNTGAPFEPFARNPQIRLSKKFGKFKAIGTLIEQVDFKSTGPLGSTPKYLINSGLPELNFRLELKTDKVYFGAGVNYKSLLPRLSISNIYGNESGLAPVNIKTNETVNGTSYYSYFTYHAPAITVRFYGIFGQMMFSMTNLGGYAEHEIIAETFVNNLETYSKITKITYTPIQTLSTWLDMNTNGKTWQFGLFGGYSQNQGAKETIGGSYYSRGSNIDYVYRLAPRLIYNEGKFRLAPEIEYTVAAYGTPDEKGVVQDSKEVANFRFLIGVYYFF